MSESFRQVRSILCEIAPTENARRMILYDIGVSTEAIDVSGAPAIAWHNSLIEIDRQGKIDSLMFHIESEYPALSNRVQAIKELRARETDFLPTPLEEEVEPEIPSGLVNALREIWYSLRTVFLVTIDIALTPTDKVRKTLTAHQRISHALLYLCVSSLIGKTGVQAWRNLNLHHNEIDYSELIDSLLSATSLLKGAIVPIYLTFVATGIVWIFCNGKRSFWNLLPNISFNIGFQLLMSSIVLFVSIWASISDLDILFLLLLISFIPSVFLLSSINSVSDVRGSAPSQKAFTRRHLAVLIGIIPSTVVAAVILTLMSFDLFASYPIPPIRRVSIRYVSNTFVLHEFHLPGTGEVDEQTYHELTLKHSMDEMMQGYYAEASFTLILSNDLNDSIEITPQSFHEFGIVEIPGEFNDPAGMMHNIVGSAVVIQMDPAEPLTLIEKGKSQQLHVTTRLPVATYHLLTKGIKKYISLYVKINYEETHSGLGSDAKAIFEVYLKNVENKTAELPDVPELIPVADGRRVRFQDRSSPKIMFVNACFLYFVKSDLKQTRPESLWLKIQRTSEDVALPKYTSFRVRIDGGKWSPLKSLQCSLQSLEEHYNEECDLQLGASDIPLIKQIAGSTVTQIELNDDKSKRNEQFQLSAKEKDAFLRVLNVYAAADGPL